MIRYVGLFVTYDPKSSEIGYLSREIISQELPLNIHKDIVDTVALCNANKLDENTQYVDMYGYVYDNATTLWELEEGSVTYE